MRLGNNERPGGNDAGEKRWEKILWCQRLILHHLVHTRAQEIWVIHARYMYLIYVFHTRLMIQDFGNSITSSGWFIWFSRISQQGLWLQRVVLNNSISLLPYKCPVALSSGWLLPCFQAPTGQLVRLAKTGFKLLVPSFCYERAPGSEHPAAPSPGWLPSCATTKTAHFKHCTTSSSRNTQAAGWQHCHQQVFPLQLKHCTPTCLTHRQSNSSSTTAQETFNPQLNHNTSPGVHICNLLSIWCSARYVSNLHTSLFL